MLGRVIVIVSLQNSISQTGCCLNFKFANVSWKPKRKNWISGVARKSLRNTENRSLIWRWLRTEVSTLITRWLWPKKYLWIRRFALLLIDQPANRKEKVFLCKYFSSFIIIFANPFFLLFTLPSPLSLPVIPLIQQEFFGSFSQECVRVCEYVVGDVRDGNCAMAKRECWEKLVAADICFSILDLPNKHIKSEKQPRKDVFFSSFHFLLDYDEMFWRKCRVRGINCLTYKITHLIIILT